MSKAPLLFIFLLCSQISFSQTFEVGGGLGVTQYKGDLNPNFNPLLSRPGVNLFGRFNFSNGFSLRTTAILAMLEGNDNLSSNPLNKAREFRFTSILNEYNVLLEYNFFNFRRYGSYRKSDWTPILFLGVGAFGLLQQKFYHAGDTDGINYHKLTALPDYTLIYGVGFKRKLGSNWNISGELGARFRLQKENRDLLDQLGYSKKTQGPSDVKYYVDPNLIDYRLQIPNTKNTADMYFYTGISLSYVLYGINCPNPRR